MAIERAGEAFRRAGATIVEVELPEWDALNSLTAIAFASEVVATHRESLMHESETYSAEVRERMLAGFAYPAVGYVGALRIRARMTRGFVESVFARAEALVCHAQRDERARRNRRQCNAGTQARHLVCDTAATSGASQSRANATGLAPMR